MIGGRYGVHNGGGLARYTVALRWDGRHCIGMGGVAFGWVGGVWMCGWRLDGMHLVSCKSLLDELKWDWSVWVPILIGLDESMKGHL